MELHLTISNYRCFSSKAPAEFVLGSGLTAVVGANNAGKSALLRFFFELRGLFEVLGAKDSPLPRAVGEALPFNSPLGDPDQLFHDNGVGDLVITIGLTSHGDESEPICDRFVITVPRGTLTFRVEIQVRGHTINDVHHWNDWYPCDANNKRVGDPDPMLRAVRALSRIRLIGPRRAASSQATSYDFDGITGSNLVSRWRTMKGGGKSGRSAASAIELQLGALFGLDRLAITTSENGQDLIVSNGTQSYQIDELGSGLGHFAVALITLGAYGETSWVLVDEPENGLHPTMQVEFLRTLANASGEGVMFATHNYGLARSVAARTYLVHRSPIGQSSTLSTPARIGSLAEFLGELGYSGYRDFGVERLLLVEGPNDVRVVDEFRRLLQLPSNVLVLPLGGSDVIHKAPGQQLAELTRICPMVYALIDSEKPSKTANLDVARMAFRSACKQLGIDCHVLERRALENYLSERAVQAVLGPDARALGHFERAAGDIKGYQAKIAARMTADEIATTDMGRFLASVYK